MANRFVLNTISYHGSGAIKEIPGELQRRGYKKIFVCSDPDLIKFGVTAKVEISDQFFGWILGFGNKAKLLYPDNVIEQFKDYMDKIREMY